MPFDHRAIATARLLALQMRHRHFTDRRISVESAQNGLPGPNCGWELASLAPELIKIEVSTGHNADPPVERQSRAGF
jgi:hypothetical protein